MRNKVYDKSKQSKQNTLPLRNFKAMFQMKSQIKEEIRAETK